MILTGDMRSAAHSGDVHALIRAASGASRIDTRRYLADVPRKQAARTTEPQETEDKPCH